MNKIILLVLWVTSFTTMAGSLDPRICGEPARYDNGRIIRSQTVIKHFKVIHPCPVTGLSYGKCKGWSVDHVIPLACGGCDSIENMQWLPNPIKSAAGTLPKDRWERKIYCTPMQTIKE